MQNASKQIYVNMARDQSK